MDVIVRAESGDQQLERSAGHPDRDCAQALQAGEDAPECLVPGGFVSEQLLLSF
jgi:hypothetical protein